MIYSNELYHHGIKGMKWGVRRFQNPDGTLTAAGQKRYGVVRQAGEYAKSASDLSYKLARDVKESSDRSIKRYGGENGWEVYAKDAYGTSSGKDFGVSQKEFEKAMKKELEDLMLQAKVFDSAAIKSYEETGKEFLEKSNKWLNSPIDSLSKKDITEAKAFMQEVQIALGEAVKVGLQTGEYVLEDNVLKSVK